MLDSIFDQNIKLVKDCIRLAEENEETPKKVNFLDMAKKKIDKTIKDLAKRRN